jgi:hypothetical protein
MFLICDTFLGWCVYKIFDSIDNTWHWQIFGHILLSSHV